MHLRCTNVVGPLGSSAKDNTPPWQLTLNIKLVLALLMNTAVAKERQCPKHNVGCSGAIGPPGDRAGCVCANVL